MPVRRGRFALYLQARQLLQGMQAPSTCSGCITSACPSACKEAEAGCLCKPGGLLGRVQDRTVAFIVQRTIS